ncbi:hypothetical protein SAMN02745168_2237 [Papillibacter cinnamivorans DSM 12816]|uniref:Uncharacterized protein n=1 Tax=Papillibacter cinnamivorans DSM 12816 TaxID=1122930 RepID=A0A1W2BIX9_9FIRM|nr:hypothetical protein SAMN02745168_2237 [Papillibacter cinnamivorans DSM 12816]
MLGGCCGCGLCALVSGCSSRSAVMVVVSVCLALMFSFGFPVWFLFCFIVGPSVVDAFSVVSVLVLWLMVNLSCCSRSAVAILGCAVGAAAVWFALLCLESGCAGLTARFNCSFWVDFLFFWGSMDLVGAGVVLFGCVRFWCELCCGLFCGCWLVVVAFCLAALSVALLELSGSCVSLRGALMLAFTAGWLAGVVFAFWMVVGGSFISVGAVVFGWPRGGRLVCARFGSVWVVFTCRGFCGCCWIWSLWVGGVGRLVRFIFALDLGFWFRFAQCVLLGGPAFRLGVFCGFSGVALFLDLFLLRLVLRFVPVPSYLAFLSDLSCFLWFLAVGSRGVLGLRVIFWREPLGRFCAVFFFPLALSPFWLVFGGLLPRPCWSYFIGCWAFVACFGTCFPFVLCVGGGEGVFHKPDGFVGISCWLASVLFYWLMGFGFLGWMGTYGGRARSWCLASDCCNCLAEFRFLCGCITLGSFFAGCVRAGGWLFCCMGWVVLFCRRGRRAGACRAFWGRRWRVFWAYFGRGAVFVPCVFFLFLSCWSRFEQGYGCPGGVVGAPRLFFLFYLHCGCVFVFGVHIPLVCAATSVCMVLAGVVIEGVVGWTVVCRYGRWRGVRGLRFVRFAFAVVWGCCVGVMSGLGDIGCAGFRLFGSCRVFSFSVVWGSFLRLSGSFYAVFPLRLVVRFEAGVGCFFVPGGAWGFCSGCCEVGCGDEVVWALGDSGCVVLPGLRPSLPGGCRGVGAGGVYLGGARLGRFGSVGRGGVCLFVVAAICFWSLRVSLGRSGLARGVVCWYVAGRVFCAAVFAIVLVGSCWVWGNCIPGGLGLGWRWLCAAGVLARSWGLVLSSVGGNGHIFVRVSLRFCFLI